VGIYLADQTRIFLLAIVTGAVVALIFDAFRISRIAIPTASMVVFFEDLLFFVICAVATFLLLLSATEGQVRFFLLIGEGIGALLYTLTVGQLVMAVSKSIIGFIKAVLRSIVRFILRPLWFILYHIVGFLLSPFYFVAGITKKYMQKLRFRLKVRRILVYNHLKTCLHRKWSPSGEPKTHEEIKENT